MAHRLPAQTAAKCNAVPVGCQRIRAGRRLAIGLSLALLAAGHPVPAATGGAAGDPVAAARAITTRLNAVRALTARFTQTLESSALPGPQIEEGTLTLQRPGRMRWDYRRPPGKVAVADGTRTWLYLPEDRQVLVGSLQASGRKQGIGILLADRIDLVAEFKAEWGVPKDRRQPPLLLLRPLSPDAEYDHLLLETDAGGFPVRLSIIDAMGGSVTYRFSDLRFDGPIDPSVFRFTPPQGVDVQEITP
jgi:outer membrane lipoprotein carrier protein